MPTAWTIISGTMVIACFLEAYYLSSPSCIGEVFCERCFNQPPSIFPGSLSFSEIRAYLLVSNDLISQEILRRNFNKSSANAASLTFPSLFWGVRVVVEKINSMTFKNNESTFAPRVYRDVFGKCGKNPCQSL